MRFPPTSWPAWIRSITMLWMSGAALSATSIETLIPAWGFGIGFDALARLLLAARAAEPERQTLQACFGLAIAASVFLRPSYSILTLSFILLLQLLLWMVGDGIFGLWGARDARRGPRSDAGAYPKAGAEAAPWRHAASGVVAVAQIGFGIGLHLWPGAGALDRGPLLAVVFLFLGVASAVEAAPGAGFSPGSEMRADSDERPTSMRGPSGK